MKEYRTKLFEIDNGTNSDGTVKLSIENILQVEEKEKSLKWRYNKSKDIPEGELVLHRSLYQINMGFSHYNNFTSFQMVLPSRKFVKELKKALDAVEQHMEFTGIS